MVENGAEGFYYQCLTDGCVGKDGNQTWFLYKERAMIHMDEVHHAVVELFRSDRVKVR